MFAVSSDIFSFLLVSALGLTVFILFSDFQDIYSGMEVRGICDSQVQWHYIHIAITTQFFLYSFWPLNTDWEAIALY